MPNTHNDTLTVGGATRGSFANQWDNGWFKIHLEAGTSYVFSMTSPYGMDYTLANAGLMLYSGNLSVAGTQGANGAGPAIAYTPAVGGDYFISPIAYGVGNFSSGKVDYQISAAVQPSDALSADIHTTGVFAADATVSGRFDFAGDIDWFKFHAEAGQHYLFSYPNGSLLPTFFSIYDAQGKELADPYSPLELATAGDYFIAVGGNVVGDYNVHAMNRVDDYAGNDSTSGVIAAGGQASGRLEYVLDTDRFHMQVQAGQIYTIDLSGDTRDSNILRLSILDEQGKQVADATPRSDGSSLRSVTFTAAASSTYSIVVSVFEYRHAGHDPYTIKASNPIPDDYGGDAATATPISLGATIEGAINFERDTDVVKLALQGGTTYVMTLTPDDPMSSQRITITDQDGKEIAASNYYSPDTNITPAASGDYYIAITGKNGSHYTLSSATPTDDFGANAGAAGTLAVGGSATGTLERSADRDWFAVDMTAGATYELSLKNGTGARLLSGNFSTTMNIVDAQGHVLAGVSSNTEAQGPQLSYRAAATGTYYVEMVAGQQLGNYVLNAALGSGDDVGNDPASATRINVGATNGRLEVSSDKDVYKIAVVAGQYYGFQIASANGASGPGLPDLQITDSQAYSGGTPVHLSYDPYANYQLYYARVSGDAYLAVGERPEAGPTSYQLLATSLGKDDYRGDNSKDASSLAIGAPMKGALNFAGDVDVVKVTLQQGTSYAFDFHGDSLNAKYRYGATLYNSNGLQVAYTGGPFGSAFGYKAAASGDYYLSVQAKVTDIHATGDYTLTTAVMDAAPQLAAPVAGASTPLGLSDKLLIDFNEKIVLGSNGSITLTDANGKTVPLDWTGGSNAPTTHLGLHAWHHLAPGATYTLDIPTGAIVDMAGNSFAGLRYTFSTVAASGAASDGNDILLGQLDGAAIHGGAGTDAVIYAGPSMGYNIVQHNGHAEVSQRYVGGATDTLDGVERLLFDDKTIALDIDGVGGKAYRLYQAAFDRAPDESGLGYWIANMDKGLSLQATAGFFLGSEEFGRRYGANLSDEDYVTQLYSNVLHRAPDADGYAYWLHDLKIGVPRANLLANFSESPENQAALIHIIGNGFSYIPYSV